MLLRQITIAPILTMHTPLKSDKPSEPILPAPPKAETVDQVSTKAFNRNKNNNKYQQNGSGGSSSHNGSPHRNNSNSRHYQQNGSNNHYQSVHQLLQQSHSHSRHQSNSRNWNRNRKANDGNNNNSNTTNNNSNTSNLSNNNNNKNYNNNNTNNNNSNKSNQSNPKLDQKNQKVSKLKSQKSQESLNQQPATVINDPSPPHSESASPTPSSSSTCFNVSSPTMNSSNSTNSEGSHKKSKYSSEFLNMVRHKMEHINNTQSHKNGKNQQQIQMQLAQMNKCKNEMDLAALRIALSGITQPDPNYNYSYYNNHHVQMMHSQQNQPQKQQQMYHHQSWTYPRSNYPMHHFEDHMSNGNHRNYQSFHRSYNNNSNNNNGNHREDLVCTCSFQYRNSNTAIYCVHCRYPLKKSNYNHRRYKNNNNQHQQNHHHNNNNHNSTYNGVINNNKNPNKNSNQLVYVNSEYYQGIPKSLSPTPTPSNSSKSESPTIENQQNSIINHHKETDMPLNVVDFDNLDDEISSEVSSTHTNQPTIIDHYTHSSMSTSSSSTASANQHPDIENYPRTPINNQQPIELVSDQNSLVANYGFWFNYPVPQSPFPSSPTVEQVHPYLSIQQYQNQTQNHNNKNQGPNQNNEESQNIMKRRMNGRVSPNMYQNPIPIQMSPNYHNLLRSGYRLPYIVAPPDFMNVSPSDRFLARAHLVEVKEPPSDLLNNSKWDRMSQSIWERFKNRQQTEETYRKKMNLWKMLYFLMRDRFLERSHPNNGLYLVGSTISGFGADTSDIDMCLVARNSMSVDPRTESLLKLGEIKAYISNSNYFEEFLLIQARVPILRFRDVVNKVEVDLNFNNCVGVRNTHLLYCYSQMDWRLRPLALIVKSWAQHHNINDARNMTISSYSLVLMVIHFLQCAAFPPVLPCLHKVYPDKFQTYQDICNIDMVEELEPIHSENRQTLGELFVDFLEYFSQFDFSRNAISIRLGSVMPIDECRAVKSYKNDPNHWKTLCIEEPFDLTNTARSVYDEEIFERIKDVFYYSWCKIRETLSLESLFGEPLFKPQPITNGYQMSYEKSGDNGAQSHIRDIKSIS